MQKSYERMMNMKHRLMQVLSLVLAMVLLFGCIPTAFAETPEIPVKPEPPPHRGENRHGAKSSGFGGTHSPNRAGGC